MAPSPRPSGRQQPPSAPRLPRPLLLLLLAAAATATATAAAATDDSGPSPPLPPPAGGSDEEAAALAAAEAAAAAAEAAVAPTPGVSHEFGALNTLLLVLVLGLCILSAYLVRVNRFYYLPEYVVGGWLMDVWGLCVYGWVGGGREGGIWM